MSPDSGEPAGGDAPRPTSPADRLVDRQLVLGVVVLGLGLYLGLPTADYCMDGVYFGIVVESALAGGPKDYLLHDHYPLYLGLLWVLQVSARSIGLVLDTLYLMQTLAAVFGALTLGLVFAFLRWLTAERGVALAGTALLSVSLSWWMFSTDAELYTICFLPLFGGYWLSLVAAESGSLRAAAGAGGCLAAAVMFHLGPVLSGPAFLLLLLRAKRRPVALVGLVGGLPAAALLLYYTLKFHFSEGLSLLAGLGAMIAGKVDTGDPYLHQFAADFGEWPLMISTLISGFLAPNAPLAALARPLIGLALLAALLAGLVGAIRGRPSARLARACGFATALVATYFVFYLAYAPWSDQGPPFFLLPFLILLSAAFLRVRGRARRIAGVAAGLGIVLLGLANLQAQQWPRSLLENSDGRVQGRWVGERTTNRDLLLLVGDENLLPLKAEIAYFENREVLELHGVFRLPRESEEPQYRYLANRALEARRRGGRVLLLAADWTPEAVADFAEERGLEPAPFRARFGAERFRLLERFDEVLALHEWEAPR